MRTIEVSGGDFRPYQVLVGRGLIGQAGARLKPFLSNARAVIVSDEIVAALHAPALSASLEAEGIAATLITVPAGEASKSFAALERLCDLLFALGGGVVGDLAGCAAAIYKRGIDFVQVPTTLLAQVDSSVGGKTAIDTPRGKNLLGAFWQPRLVLCDLDVLATLPEREVRCGYAEVIKYGLLGDREFFERLEAEGPAVVALHGGPLAHAVARSIEMKAEIVGEDSREAGRRALLNLGHP